MGDKSGIEWTEATWNPLTGCTQVSPGCAHCYAKSLAKRLKAMGNPRYTNEFELTLQEDLLSLPVRWTKPRMIFVNSMSDLFHEDVPLEYIKRVFEVMNKTERHTFQILTKRHERLAELAAGGQLTWTSNMWQGVSIENNRFTLRADYLRQVPATIRFLSCEPLLTDLPSLDLRDIHWVIAGAESGPKARPMNVQWVRNLRDKCQAAGTAFYLKQFVTRGGRKIGLPELDGRKWEEMPVK